MTSSYHYELFLNKQLNYNNIYKTLINIKSISDAIIECDKEPIAVAWNLDLYTDTLQLFRCNDFTETHIIDMKKSFDATKSSIVGFKSLMANKNSVTYNNICPKIQYKNFEKLQLFMPERKMKGVVVNDLNQAMKLCNQSYNCDMFTFSSKNKTMEIYQCDENLDNLVEYNNSIIVKDDSTDLRYKPENDFFFNSFTIKNIQSDISDVTYKKLSASCSGGNPIYKFQRYKNKKFIKLPYTLIDNIDSELKAATESLNDIDTYMFFWDGLNNKLYKYKCNDISFNDLSFILDDNNNIFSQTEIDQFTESKYYMIGFKKSSVCNTKPFPGIENYTYLNDRKLNCDLFANGIKKNKTIKTLRDAVMTCKNDENCNVFNWNPDNQTYYSCDCDDYSHHEFSKLTDHPDNFQENSIVGQNKYPKKHCVDTRNEIKNFNMFGERNINCFNPTTISYTLNKDDQTKIEKYEVELKDLARNCYEDPSCVYFTYDKINKQGIKCGCEDKAADNLRQFTYDSNKEKFMLTGFKESSLCYINPINRYSLDAIKKFVDLFTNYFIKIDSTLVCDSTEKYNIDVSFESALATCSQNSDTCAAVIWDSLEKRAYTCRCNDYSITDVYNSMINKYPKLITGGVEFNRIVAFTSKNLCSKNPNDQYNPQMSFALLSNSPPISILHSNTNKFIKYINNTYIELSSERTNKVARADLIDKCQWKLHKITQLNPFENDKSETFAIIRTYYSNLYECIEIQNNGKVVTHTFNNLNDLQNYENCHFIFLYSKINIEKIAFQCVSNELLLIIDPTDTSFRLKSERSFISKYDSTTNSIIKSNSILSNDPNTNNTLDIPDIVNDIQNNENIDINKQRARSFLTSNNSLETIIPNYAFFQIQSWNASLIKGGDNDNNNLLSLIGSGINFTLLHSLSNRLLKVKNNILQLTEAEYKAGDTFNIENTEKRIISFKAVGKGYYFSLLHNDSNKLIKVLSEKIESSSPDTSSPDPSSPDTSDKYLSFNEYQSKNITLSEQYTFDDNNYEKAIPISINSELPEEIFRPIFHESYKYKNKFMLLNVRTAECLVANPTTDIIEMQKIKITNSDNYPNYVWWMSTKFFD